jgi:hypothetical protein
VSILPISTRARVFARAALAVLSILATATPARADANLAVGALAFRGVFPVIGISAGHSHDFGEFVGWELEFAKALRGGPTTYGGSVLVRSSVIADTLRVYGSFGMGLHGPGPSSGQIGFLSVGGGTKIRTAGPLWLRLDYRVLLHGADTPPDIRHLQRVMGGVGVEF